jgi:DNA polymerase-3 subunit delta
LTGANCSLQGGNMSLFGDKKLIDLRIPTGKPGKEGGAALQQWCQHLSLDNLLLITLPELDWREEKAVWFTALGQCRHRR